MMKIACLALLIQFIVVLGNPVFGQRKTFFGFEGSIANDLYKIEDSGNSLKSVPIYTGLWGISIRQELNNKLFVEVGVFSKVYWQTIAFNPEFYVYITPFNALVIPVRLGYSIKLSKNISLLLMPGVTLGINLNAALASDGGSGWITTGNGLRADYYYKENDDVSRCFMLVNPSIGIERKFFNTVLLSLYAVRNFGFNKVKQLDINYTINGSAPVEAKQVSYGEFWSLGLSLKYPISNIWQK